MIGWRRGILTVVTAVMVLSGGCARSPQAKEAKYLEKGKEEFQKKNYAAAIIHFKNATLAMPTDAEAYYQLGLAYLASNDLNSAGSCFFRATERDPKHTGAQLKLAQLLATSRSKDVLEDAQKRSQDVLNLLPDNVEALNTLAITELRLGNPESAEEHLEQALRKAPDDLKSSVALAQSKAARKDIAGAEAVLKQAVAQAPKSPAPSVYLGGFYLALGRTAEAEEQLRHALQIDPKSAPALLELAGMQARAGQSDQAEQTYRQISALPDQQYRPAHAFYLFQSGKQEQAVDEFQKLAEKDPSDRAIRTDLVRAYLALNRIADAEKVLTAALKKNSRDADALLQRSQIYLASQKYDQAESDLNQVPQSAEAHYLLAKVQQARGKVAAQQQELREALKLNAGYLAARVELAKVLIATGGAQSALQLLDQAPAEQKNATALTAQRNWAQMMLGQTAEAQKGVDQVLKAGKVPDAELQDAILKMNKKDNSASRALINEVLKQNPGDIRALSLLMQSYSAENKASAGVQKVREFAATQPSSAPVQEFLGQLLLQSGDRPGARQAFEAAKAKDPRMFRADVALAELDRYDGKLDDARKRLSAVIASHPEDATSHLFLAQVESIDGKTPAAIELYKKAVELDSHNAMAFNNLAYLLAESNQPDEALKFAQKAKELAPESPLVDDTLGWTYYRKGMYSLAVAHLESAVAKEGSARRQYHLAMACLKAGDQSQGRKALEAALKIDPKLPEAQLARQMFGEGTK